MFHDEEDELQCKVQGIWTEVQALPYLSSGISRASQNNLPEDLKLTSGLDSNNKNNGH